MDNAPEGEYLVFNYIICDLFKIVLDLKKKNGSTIYIRYLLLDYLIIILHLKQFK